MRQAPNHWQVDYLAEYLRSGRCTAQIDGHYVPARPLGFYSLQSRMHLAWLVFTGRADALTWPGQEARYDAR